MIDSDDIDNVPGLTLSLVSALEDRIPECCPSPATTERDDLYHAGRRSVVHFLRRVLEDQIEREKERFRE